MKIQMNDKNNKIYKINSYYGNRGNKRLSGAYPALYKGQSYFHKTKWTKQNGQNGSGV